MNLKTKWTLSLTVASSLLGFMMAVQYRQAQVNQVDLPSVSSATTEQQKLQREFEVLKSANANDERRLATLTERVSAYEKRMAGTNSRLEQLQMRLQDERILAGLTPVSGPGVSVVLMDGIAVGSNTEEVLTHDWDVRSVINELFTAGAEAVDINGYRVVATSGIFCTGPVVRINGHSIGAPFQIEAIGDPSTLSSALNLQGGILDALRSRGVNVSPPTVQKKIEMPAFTGASSLSPAGGTAAG